MSKYTNEIHNLVNNTLIGGGLGEIRLVPLPMPLFNDSFGNWPAADMFRLMGVMFVKLGEDPGLTYRPLDIKDGWTSVITSSIKDIFRLFGCKKSMN